MNFDLLDEVIGYLPLKDVVHNISIASKCMNGVAQYYKSNELYDLSDIDDLDKVYKITTDWRRLKFEYNRQYDNQLKVVSMLKNIHTLDLEGCDQIQDMSMLRNVHTLRLSDCNQIQDISMLGNVHTQIQYISMFEKST